jgi:hypothetical protein
VAQHGSCSARKKSGHLVGPFADDRPDEMDAAVNLSKSPVLQTGRDLLRRDAGSQKLPALDCPVLPACDRRNDPIGRPSEHLWLHSNHNPALDRDALPRRHPIG